MPNDVIDEKNSMKSSGSPPKTSATRTPTSAFDRHAARKRASSIVARLASASTIAECTTPLVGSARPSQRSAAIRSRAAASDARSLASARR
ncbi:polyketide synthase domain protein [Burkholderia pseudomallei]|nr:polyketide synthase domain protein [Burkholderia pseudomallei]